MNRLKNVLKKLLVINLILFALTAIASNVIATIAVAYIFGIINLISLILLPINVYIYLLTEDIIAGADYRRIQFVFYSAVILTFSSLFYIKYVHALNGYLFFIPFIVSIVSLVNLSIFFFVNAKSKRIVVKAWLFFGTSFALSIVVLKFLFHTI